MASKTRTPSAVFPRGAAEQQGRRAGVISRTIVMVLDAAAVVILGAVLYLVIATIRLMRAPRRFTWPQVAWGEAVVVLGVLCVIYLTVSWSSTGRSLGKRLMGLRVVDRAGAHLRIGRAFLRALTCTVFPLALYWCVVSRRSASGQDLVFGTSVVYDWRSRLSPGGPSNGDALGVAVDVQPTVADEPDDGHAEPLAGVDGE